jgi:hypothetical protein
MEIRLLVINLNNKDYTKNCINSLINQKCKNFMMDRIIGNNPLKKTPY